MKITANTDKGEKTETEYKVLYITGKDGKRYRIADDYEHGLDILAEDGRALVEPHTSNHITVFTAD